QKQQDGRRRSQTLAAKMGHRRVRDRHELSALAPYPHAEIRILPVGEEGGFEQSRLCQCSRAEERSRSADPSMIVDAESGEFSRLEQLPISRLKIDGASCRLFIAVLVDQSGAG